MKIRMPRRRIWRVAIYSISFLLVLTAADMILVQMRRTIHPGYDTTRITAPLQPDGSIDYLVAVDNRMSAGVTPDNNAAVLLLQAFGRKALAPKQPPDGVTDRLGMPHLPEQGDYFITHDEYTKQHPEWVREDLTDMNYPFTWPTKVDDLTAHWVKDNTKALSLVTQASRQTRFFIPLFAGYRYETMIEVLLPHLLPFRDCANALNARAIMRIKEGDMAGFRDDVVTAHRIARLLSHQPTLIERLVAMHMEKTTCEVERVALDTGKFSGDQARALATELDALGDLPSFTDAVDQGERVFALDTLQALARQGPVRAGELLNAVLQQPDGGLAPPAVFRFVPIPYEALMRSVNQSNDRLLDILQKPTYQSSIFSFKQWEQQINAKRVEQLSVWDLMNKDWPMQLFAPSMLKILQTETTGQMERRLTQLALMLAAYKSDHGEYPASLADLSPAYLATVPIDLFTEKPLIYSRVENKYVLYSVGPNGEDDHGKKDDLVASTFVMETPPPKH